MIKLNLDTLGIIFPNSYDKMVPDMVNVRLKDWTKRYGQRKCKGR